MSPTPEIPSHQNLHVRLLGGFRACYAGKPITGLAKGRTRDLLAYLLLHHTVLVSRQQLAYTLWPDTSDKQARTNLRTVLARLRREVKDVDHFLSVTRQAIQLRGDARLQTDVLEYERLLRAANETINDNERMQQLEQAVTIYRGDLLPDCYDDWIAPERERLRDAHLHALETLILLYEAQRRYDDAIRHAQRLLRADPLHEATYRRLMRLHALNSDRAGALRVYHTYVDTLQRELDVAPGPKTQAAYQRLLRRDAATTPPPVRLGQAQLVGRHDEWNRLIGAWRRATAGEPHMVAITGEAGMGKTRLAEEMVAWAERQGIVVGVAHCYATERDLAYGPLTEWLQAEGIREYWTTLDEFWLAELARIFPSLLSERPDITVPDPLNARWQRQRLFETLARAMLAGGQPLLLLIDDLQWSDAETLNWLHYLLQFNAQQPLLIVATVRLEEIADGHRYQPIRLALQQSDHLTEIQLGPLSADDTATLADGLSTHALTAPQAADLFRETEGNPLFVVETLQTGIEGQGSELKIGGISPASRVGLQSLPVKVAAVLQQRLAQLSPAAAQLMQLAAVIGRAFTFDLLAHLCEQGDDAVVDALDEAWQRRIIREQGVNAYDFTHDKLRTVAYAQISPVRRRYLHRRVATILASQQTGETDDLYAQIAHHFVEAGDRMQAADYYRRAVNIASRRYAIESLLSASTTALTLLQQLDPDMRDPANLRNQVGVIDERMWSWEMVGDMDAYLRDLALLKAIGGALQDEAILRRESRLHAAALIRLGRYREAESIALASAAYHNGVDAAEDEGISLTVVGRARRELGEHDRAISAFSQALSVLAQVDAYVYQIQAHSYLSTTYWLMGDYEQALRCGQAALTICEEQAMSERKRFALGDMGAAAAMLGQRATARQWLHESLRLAELVTDSTQEAFCRGHLGWLALRAGELDEAERELQAAYDLSQRADITNYASWLLRGLAEMAAARGQSDRAYTFAAEALAIATRNRQVGERQSAQRLLEQLS